MRKALLLILICINSVIVHAQQTYNITGIVTDEKDVPIPGATVFLADSRKATVSDADGRFTLQQVQPGKYNIVVKMIGYIVTTHEFLLQNNNMRFRFKLPEDNIVLNTVEISAMSWVERKRHLATFIRCFFGASKNAEQCKILNTDDIKIRFDKKTNVLTASSNEFLIIENKALGYRMKYLLSNFLFDSSLTGGGLISFDGTVFFEDMKGSARQIKKWEEERANVYLGSIPHYFRSLFNNTLEQNGFITYILPIPKVLNKMAMNKPEMLGKYFRPVNSLSKYINRVDSNFKTFDLGLLRKDSTELYVLYTPKKEPQEFLDKGTKVNRYFKVPVGQLSIIRPTQDSLLISSRGDISPVSSILYIGYLAWGQVSSFLPSDYELPKNTKIPDENKFSQLPGTISVRKADQ
ncbi:carboxypeptidase-like regulatory domain-containing protein [Mucilaginibacter auburnensis]|nr:carboxypeptidase-like regulatory domain-containing protein [Mucilaginibacter auburnensis]